MSRDSWYRRTSWTDHDRDEFESRLKRSRSAGNKAQYLRIQAWYLADWGHHTAAIELLDRVLQDHPDSFDVPLALLQRAESLAAVGSTNEAVEAFRAALDAERADPNITIHTWSKFGLFVVEQQRHDLYAEILSVLEEFCDAVQLDLPILQYRYCTIRALIAASSGEAAVARDYAQQALEFAACQHSGFRYHPTFGLVGAEHDRHRQKLLQLAQEQSRWNLGAWWPFHMCS